MKFAGVGIKADYESFSKDNEVLSFSLAKTKGAFKEEELAIIDESIICAG